VDVGKKATLSQGVAVRVTKITNVQVEATGPGDIAGPGVAVHLTVTNSSTTTVDLDGFTVTASYGSKDRPASPGGTGTDSPLSGPLKPGAKASGVYVYTVPRAQADTVQIQVSSNEFPNILVVQR
jgi:hypothetical protein